LVAYHLDAAFPYLEEVIITYDEKEDLDAGLIHREPWVEVEGRLGEARLRHRNLSVE